MEEKEKYYDNEYNTDYEDDKELNTASDDENTESENKAAGNDDDEDDLIINEEWEEKLTDEILDKRFSAHLKENKGHLKSVTEYLSSVEDELSILKEKEGTAGQLTGAEGRRLQKLEDEYAKYLPIKSELERKVRDLSSEDVIEELKNDPKIRREWAEEEVSKRKEQEIQNKKIQFLIENPVLNRSCKKYDKKIDAIFIKELDKLGPPNWLSKRYIRNAENIINKITEGNKMNSEHKQEINRTGINRKNDVGGVSRQSGSSNYDDRLLSKYDRATIKSAIEFGLLDGFGTTDSEGNFRPIKFEDAVTKYTEAVKRNIANGKRYNN